MKSNTFILLLAIFQSIFFSANSQNFPDTYFESKSGKLEYGFFIPEGNETGKEFPLVIYLHGWSNNYSVYLRWYDAEIQRKNPCFVYTPKTPTDWADWSGWSDQLTEPMQTAIRVLDSLTEIYPVDKNRIYVYGISMGGEGTFDLLDKLPDKFAAAMSVCGGGKPEWAGNISKTPIWMFHGSADGINPPKLTEEVYDEMVRIGAKKMRYTSYKDYGHDIWDLAEAEPSWYDWMFSFSRNDTNFQAPNGKIQLKLDELENGKIQLSWNDIRNQENPADKIWYYKIFNSQGIIGITEFDKTSVILKKPENKESYYIAAVNYHFQESKPSGKVKFK